MKAAQVLAISLIICFLSTSKASQKPNFIIFFLDDTGYGDVSAYKQPCQAEYQCPVPETPNIDKLASEGIMFTNFYAAHPVCSPSRAAILTGRYPIRTGVFPSVFSPASIYGLPVGEVTIAKLLKEAGYKTGMVGKWHLGDTPEYLPTSHGFDSYYGIPWSHDYCPCPCNLTLTEDCNCRPSDPPCPIFHNTQIVQQPAYLPDLAQTYKSQGLSFLEENKDDPFFLYYCFQHSHHPQFNSPQYVNATKRGAYGNSMLELDHVIGQIMDYLDSSGLSDDTLVFLTSDNGPSLIRFKFGGSAGELRCGKGTTWEGGQRVPGLARWKGVIEPGRVVDDIVTNMDIFPTILKIAGVDAPTDRPIDGVDMSDILTNKNNGSRDHFFYYGLKAEMNAVRLGKYKAHFYTSGWGKSPAALCGDTKEVKHDPPLLFDLSKDPNEANPLSSTTPEYKTIISQINALVTAHNCNSKSDPCYNVYGPKGIFDGNKKCEPFPPVPFKPWTPNCKPEAYGTFPLVGNSEYDFM